MKWRQPTWGECFAVGVVASASALVFFMAKLDLHAYINVALSISFFIWGLALLIKGRVER